MGPAVHCCGTQLYDRSGFCVRVALGWPTSVRRLRTVDPRSLPLLSACPSLSLHEFNARNDGWNEHLTRSQKYGRPSGRTEQTEPQISYKGCPQQLRESLLLARWNLACKGNSSADEEQQERRHDHGAEEACDGGRRGRWHPALATSPPVHLPRPRQVGAHRATRSNAVDPDLGSEFMRERHHATSAPTKCPIKQSPIEFLRYS